jgi:hypothetical protein
MLLLIYKPKGHHIPEDSNLQHTQYYAISHKVSNRLMRKQVCKLRIIGPSKGKGIVVPVHMGEWMYRSTFS